MRKTLLAVVPLVLAATAIPAAANIGGNDYRDCTRTEYQAVHRGHSLASVQRKLDGKGKVKVQFGSYQSRQWGVGVSNGWCIIDFEQKRVTSRAYIG